MRSEGVHAIEYSGTSSSLQRKSGTFGCWAAWLCDALDATVFSLVLLPLAKSMAVGIGDIVSAAAWFLLATGVGGLVLGRLADRIGRKRAMMACIFTYALGTYLCSRATSLTELCVLRFLVGLGVGGLWSSVAAMVAETAPADRRARSFALVQTGWSLGGLAAAGLAWATLDRADPQSWRTLFAVASLPSFVTLLFVTFFVRESPVWLAGQQQGGARSVRTIWVMFGPDLRLTTFLGLLVSCLGMYGYWVISIFMPASLTAVLGVALDEAPVFVLCLGAGATIGYLVFGRLAERWGRRTSFVAFFLGMAVALPAFVGVAVIMPLDGGRLAMTAINVASVGTMAAVLGFFTGYFSGFGPWYAELFPTDIRASAAGFCFNGGRVGAIAGIKLVPIMVPVVGYPLTLCATSAAYLLAALIVLGMRETRGVILAPANPQ